MSKLTYMRILGYVFTLTMHGLNYVVVYNSLLPPKFEALNFVITVFWRYFTIWNVVFQTLYAILGLTCDVLTLIKGKQKLASLISFREMIFTVVIWTSCCVVAAGFWPSFLYDRSLIYPEFIDQGIPPWSNYVFHGGILLVVLWEFLCLPREENVSHMKSFKIMASVFSVYYLWIQYSYMVTGLWPYPMINLVYGTRYFPIGILGVFAMMISFYFMQWPLVKYVWSKPCKKVD